MSGQIINGIKIDTKIYLIMDILYKGHKYYLQHDENGNPIGVNGKVYPKEQFEDMFDNTDDKENISYLSESNYQHITHSEIETVIDGYKAKVSMTRTYTNVEYYNKHDKISKEQEKKREKLRRSYSIPYRNIYKLVRTNTSYEDIPFQIIDGNVYIESMTGENILLPDVKATCELVVMKGNDREYHYTRSNSFEIIAEYKLI